jgi:hypothetical protein
MKYTEAFAEFGATLRNPRWAYSAIAQDGSLVLSCWARYLCEQPDGVLRYQIDDFKQWTSNAPGKSLLTQHLRQAQDDGLPVRMVLVTTTPVHAKVAGVSGTKVKKRFKPRHDLVGSVVEFAAERVVVDFRAIED